MKKVIITGASSGIGRGLAKKYLELGWMVFAVSRRESPIKHENFKNVQADLSDFTNVPGALFELLGKPEHLDLVVLNAGILGEIVDMADVDIASMKKTMDINLWSNKVILDWLFKHSGVVEQVVAISSGAAVNGNRGWNGYSISKAALNMLVKLYAAENPSTHFCSLAPGLVDTAMQDYLCGQKETEKFPSLSKIQSSRGTKSMPTPEQVSEKLCHVIAEVTSFQSGCFKDIRKM
ncbi:MAG: SDR family NAD(P)-dependent oxidoreductase [Lentisphaerales bacterium]|nr:SDR family NAD(P)-dependent oxidoreductase [Lentisphaerales bacterium]